MDRGWLNDLPHMSMLSLDTKSILSIEEAQKEKETWQSVKSNAFSYEETQPDYVLWAEHSSNPLESNLPAEFGGLGHANADGLTRLRFHYGTVAQAYVRCQEGERAVYEAAKFNQRLHPKPQRVGNDERTGVSVYKPTEDDLKAASLAHWPLIGGIVTRAPYLANVKETRDGSVISPFASPQASQPRMLEVVFKTQELRDQILSKLFARMEDLSNWTRTCQFAMNTTSASVTYLGTSPPDFLQLDKSDRVLDAAVEAGKMTEADRDSIRVGKFLMICPIRGNVTIADGFRGKASVFWPPNVRRRGQKKEDADYHDLFTSTGWRKDVGYQIEGPGPSSERDYTAMIKTLRTIFYHGRAIENLKLGRLRFLTSKILVAALDRMPNIKTLSIESCAELQLCNLKEILKKVAEINKARKQQNRELLDFDFFPQFRQGPVGNRFGSYGVTHNDPTIYGPKDEHWNTTIDKALQTFLVSTMRLQREAQVDLLRPGKGLRLWLDKLPLSPGQAERMVMAAASWSDFNAHWLTRINAVPGHLRKRLGQRVVADAMYQTVWGELVIAATAEPIQFSEIKEQGITRCGMCDVNLPTSLFRPGAQAHGSDDQKYCRGCELMLQIRAEYDFNKVEYRLVSDVLLWDGAPETSLDWLFSGEEQAKENLAVANTTAKNLFTPEEQRQWIEDVEEKRESNRAQQRTIWDYRDRKELIQEEKKMTAEIDLVSVKMGLQMAPGDNPGDIRGTYHNWDYLRKVYKYATELEEGKGDIEGPHNIRTFKSYAAAFNGR